MFKSRWLNIIVFAAAVFIAALIILCVLPVKSRVNLDKIDADSYPQDIVVVCRFAQVTGGDWQVVKIIKGGESDVTDHIYAKGNYPKISFSRWTGMTPFGDTEFIFAGSYAGEGMEGDKMILVEKWDLASQYRPAGHLFFNIPKDYLNIFDYRDLIQ